MDKIRFMKDFSFVVQMYNQSQDVQQQKNTCNKMADKPKSNVRASCIVQTPKSQLEIPNQPLNYVQIGEPTSIIKEVINRFIYYCN
uniref:Uncharacterized protein n=1 Tax=Cucumis melo TaxID=3656 RepID=A0A9I9D308_CUCME